MMLLLRMLRLWTSPRSASHFPAIACIADASLGAVIGDASLGCVLSESVAGTAAISDVGLACP